MTDRNVWASFPLHAMNGGSCACGHSACTRIGKHPDYPYGQVKKGQQIPGKPGQGRGILTGSRSGIFVVDLDNEEAILAFQAMGDLPETYTVQTPRGMHLYFTLPAGANVRGNAGKLGPGIDVRGEGGFVVGPGSMHRSGKTYAVLEDRPVADPPAWLLEAVTAAPRATGEKVQAVDVSTPTGKKRIAKAREYLATAPPSIEHQGGHLMAFTVAQKLVREFALPLETAEELMHEIYNPRCSPPWSTAEILHKLESARDTGTFKTAAELEPVETWAENVQASRVCAEGKRVKDSGRKTKDPRHVYTFVAGERAATERKKIALSDAASDLYSHVDWAGVWQFDILRDRLFAVDPPMRLDAETTGLSEDDIVSVRCWFESNGIAIGKLDAFDAVHRAARRNGFDPLREYLQGLASCPGILDDLATKALGNADAHANLCLKMFLVSAVRRALRPGCKVDTVPVLYGKQGAGKSSFVEALFGEAFTRSQMPDLSNKDASEALKGFWAIELAEMDGVLRTESSTVKEFLTRKVDDYRPAYGRSEIHAPRRCVFVGTTNEDRFLRDSTGDRRFWPIEVLREQVDLPYIVAHRDEIWGEAVALAATPFKHWFDDEEASNRARAPFIVEDAWQDAIQGYCEGRDWISSASEVCEKALMMPTKDISRLDQLRVTATLRRLGLDSTVRAVDGKSKRGWRVPAHLAAMKKRTPGELLANPAFRPN